MTTDERTRHEILTDAGDRRVRVLRLIETAISTKGYPPSISELAAATDVSTLTIRRDLANLESTGRIERDAGVTRGIRLVP